MLTTGDIELLRAALLFVSKKSFKGRWRTKNNCLIRLMSAELSHSQCTTVCW